MVESTGSRRSDGRVIQNVVLGLGCLVQGLRSYPMRAVSYFLRDGLKVEPYTIQVLKNSITLPMIAKPLYGIISDAFYIRGQHRIPYIAFGAFLQAVSWLALALLSSKNIMVISAYLLLSNLGAGIAEVANDAIVAELGKQAASSEKGPQSTFSAELQSFVWMASSIGGVLGNLLGGMAIARFAPETNFLIFSLMLTLQFLLTMTFRESSLNLSKNRSHEGIKKQLSDLWLILKRPEIAYSIVWSAASYAVIPDLSGIMFFYHSYLKIEKSVSGIGKVLSKVVMLLWSIVYNRSLKSVPPRRLIFNIQVMVAIFMILDALSVDGFFRALGISDSVYSIIFSGFAEVLYLFKILPISVLMAQHCPPGCEGSLMAIVISAIELALMVSGYWGIAVTSYFGVTKNNFGKLSQVISIQAVCTLLPLFWSSWIPDDTRSRRRRRQVCLRDQ